MNSKGYSQNSIGAFNTWAYRQLAESIEDPNYGIAARVETSRAILYASATVMFIELIIIYRKYAKTGLTTLLGIFFFLFSGISIFMIIFWNRWAVAIVVLNDVQYSSLTNESFNGILEVNIGMTGANFYLEGNVKSNLDNQDIKSAAQVINYNERFWWYQLEEMRHLHCGELSKCPPDPVIEAINFIIRDTRSNCWFNLCEATFFSSQGFYLITVTWLISGIVMYKSRWHYNMMKFLIGSLLTLSVSVYFISIKQNDGYFVDPNRKLSGFRLGETYYLLLLLCANSVYAGAIPIAEMIIYRWCKMPKVEDLELDIFP